MTIALLLIASGCVFAVVGNLVSLALLVRMHNREGLARSSPEQTQPLAAAWPPPATPSPLAPAVSLALTGPRFRVVGVDALGEPLEGCYEGNDAEAAADAWHRFRHGDCPGRFTFYDRLHAGHRGDFVRVAR